MGTGKPNAFEKGHSSKERPGQGLEASNGTLTWLSKE